MGALIGAFSKIIASKDENNAFGNWVIDKEYTDRTIYEKYLNFGSSTHLLNPMVLSGLIIGTMLPYYFSALTMKSVGTAAYKMVKHVRKQFQMNPGIIIGTEKPNYSSCIEISTIASLKEMVKPACLVLLTPIVF